MNHTALKDKLQNEIDSLVGKNSDVFSAVIGIRNAKGDFHWSGAAGSAYAGKSEDIKVDTPIFIASITKMYTSAATMILEERGQLSLNDPLSKFLPNQLVDGLHRYKGIDYSNQLNIYHLISQTSGLPDYFLDKPKGGQSVFERLVAEVDFAWDLQEVVDIAKNKLSPKFPPQPVSDTSSSKKAYYADTNYQILGAILEAVTQKPQHEIYSELIIEPLGLNSTYLYGHEKPQVTPNTPPADIYHKTQPMFLNLAMKSFGPDGGMVSTIEDSLNFLRVFLEGKLFTHPSTLERMKNWHKIFFPFQYGLGLMRFKLPKIFSPFSPNPELVGHSGATSAFLYYSDIGQLYIAGTLNQTENQGRPYRMLIRLINIINKEIS